MNKKIFFVMVGIFLFFTLLYIPTKAKAGDLMRWEPHTFAGGAPVSYGDLLSTAIVIKHGPGALHDYIYSPYYYYDYFTNSPTNIENYDFGDFASGGGPIDLGDTTFNDAGLNVSK